MRTRSWWSPRLSRRVVAACCAGLCAAAAPDPASAADRARFQDSRFPLSEAVNLAAVEERFGAFTPAQRAFLEKHRFLLAPRTDIGWGGNDEMLDDFDAIATREVEAEDEHGKPVNRAKRPGDPAGARLYNPDIFLHTLHIYLFRRMRDLELEHLAPALERLLAALAEEGLKPGASDADRQAAAALLVPWALLKPALSAEAGGQEDGTAAEPDTLRASLSALEPYRARLGEARFAAARTELERVYAADTSAESALPGWQGAYTLRGEVDYTAHKPRGYYVHDARLRGWFRAMIQLGQNGFALKDDRGLASAVAFAGLLRRAPAPSARLADGEDGLGGAALQPAEAMARIMRISALFHGLPDTATPAEWLPFLEKTLGRAPDGRSAEDPAALARVREALDKEGVWAGNRTFAGIREDKPARVLSLFPARFTLPWFIADRLTGKTPADPLPMRFSALWVPALFGDATARGLLPMQVRKALAECVDVDPRLTPKSCPPAADGAKTRAALSALREGMDDAARRLEAVTPADWDSSFAAGRMKLLTTLNARFGEGYPLYMRDALFGAKQLESQLGAYTELKYDAVLFEKPNYVEGDGEDETIAVRPPLSFVEPNLPFWRELRRQVRLIERVFRENGLFPNDLEEYGRLAAFREAVDLCATVAEKELAGQRPTAREIDRLHKLELARVASPMGRMLERKEWLSGLIVDVQSAGDARIYEALGAPRRMFVLVGSGADRRIVVGLAYNHFEFTGPGGERFNDDDWQPRAYGPAYAGDDGDDDGKTKPAQAGPLPGKNFWYEGLLP